MVYVAIEQTINGDYFPPRVFETLPEAKRYAYRVASEHTGAVLNQDDYDEEAHRDLEFHYPSGWVKIYRTDVEK